MAEAHFYLKKPEPGRKVGLIYLQFKYGRGTDAQKFVYTFGLKIDPKNWDKDRGQVKGKVQTDETGEYKINDLLQGLKKECKKAYLTELENGCPTKAALKSHLDAFMFRNGRAEKKAKEGPTLYNLIERFIKGEIKAAGGADKTRGTLTTYKTTYNHLQNFERKANYPISFTSINLEFYYKFNDYLKNVMKLKPNTIGKEFKTVKIFMNEAVDLGYTTNLEFRKKKFSVKKEETDAVYLTEKELEILYKHDFKGHLKYEQVRDLFVFGAWVGLRYSDYSNIKPQNIVQKDGEYYLKVTTQKTGEPLVIHCNTVVMDIFKKYKDSPNMLPRAISNQKFNDFIKEVCKDAGLTEIGRLSTDLNKPLWECVSSHTARRSFATNAFKQGMSPYDIMKITGHKTEKSFKVYIKMTNQDAAERQAEHNKKVALNKGLRVAI